MLNHMEFVHRPGEAHLVLELFRLLGLEPFEGQFLVGSIDPATSNRVDNILAGSEVRAEQWAFDQALAEAVREGPLSGAFAGYQDLLVRAPQWGMHVGIRFDSLDDWEGTVGRVGDVERTAPALAGRVALRGVFRPGDQGSVSDVVHQAFMWTDVIACGSLALGQHLELQYADLARVAARAAR
jgi:hypothetical protein